jgi:hypothetical protein
MISTALALARKNLAVFPCMPADKTPACTHGCKDATTDIIAIQTWWQENPRYNIGIATGAVSSIFVIDIDNGEADGEAEWDKLLDQHGVLMPTVEVITARGRHLYFRYPSVPVRNSAGKIAPGIDVRGDGGYVLAPPSRHPTGKRYCWSVDSTSAIAEAPPWLIDLVATPTNGNGATAPSEWRTLVAGGVVEGQRDCTVAKLAGLLLRRFVDPIVTLELLQAWNATRCSPPLPPKDIERIVDSIAGRELRRRGGG